MNQTNELIDAQAKLSKFNKQDTTFENGEMRLVSVVTGGRDQIGIEAYAKEVGLLANADFGRTKSLTEK